MVRGVMMKMLPLATPTPMMMEPTPWWCGEDSGMMDEVMDMMESRGGGGGLMMRPSTWSRSRRLSCPYDANSGWRSCMKKLLQSPPSGVLIVPRYNKDTTSSNTDKCSDRDQCNTCNSQDTTPSCHCNRAKATNDNATKPTKTNHESSGSTSPASSNKETPVGSHEAPWQFSVDMRGCEEVRAFTDSGALTVEGRGRRGHSRMMVHHVTTLPPHLPPDTLTATLRDGQLSVSQRPGSHGSHVTVLPIVIPEEHDSASHPHPTEQLQEEHEHSQLSQHGQQQEQQSQQQEQQLARSKKQEQREEDENETQQSSE